MRCFEVKEVIGVSLCQISAMSNRDRRAGRKRGAHDICCEVRGGFGEDAHNAESPWAQTTIAAKWRLRAGTPFVSL